MYIFIYEINKEVYSASKVHLFNPFLNYIMFIAYGLLSTKKRLNTLIQQTNHFLMILKRVRDLRIDWAINPSDDRRVVLRVVGL